MSNITLNLQSTIESHNLIGIEYISPDFDQIIDLVDQLVNSKRKEENQVPIYVYSHAQKLQRVIEGIGEDSNVLKSVPMGADPTIPYLKEFMDYPGSGVFIFKDLHQSFYHKPSKTFCPIIPSYLRTIASCEFETDQYKKIIFLGEKIEIAPELLRLLPVLTIPLPNQQSRENAIQSFLIDKQLNHTLELDIYNIARAAAGLSTGEITQQIHYHYHQCFLENQDISSVRVQQHITHYKTNLLKKLKIEVIEPRPTNFGGHEILKQWLNDAKVLMQPAMASYGLPPYKGCLLGGVSGCGKTLVAETIAHEWNLPLIKLSIPALKGGLVGQSENNLKNALKLIENIKGIVLLDEVEKAISGRGTDSSGVSDGMLSILLDWMNAQDSQFIVATANDVKRIPSELMRSGRLNERWFVGLPGKDARREILEIHLFNDSRKIDPDYRETLETQVIDILVGKIEGLSGAEIAETVIRGLRTAVLNQRPQRPILQDFLQDIPASLAKSHSEQHQEIMAWSQNAKPTSKDIIRF